MNLRILGLTAFFAVTAAVPASATFVGDVHVSDQVDQHGKEVRSFTGPVSQLEFSTPDDVSCSSIEITFADGSTRNVFSGTLTEGTPQSVELGRRTDVESVTFKCWARGMDNARIEVASDTDPTLPGPTGL